MLKRHKIKETSVWDRRLIVVLGSLFAITLLLVAVWVLTLLMNSAEVDDCLDRGGSYDYELGECDFDKNHPKP